LIIESSLLAVVDVSECPAVIAVEAFVWIGDCPGDTVEEGESFVEGWAMLEFGEIDSWCKGWISFAWNVEDLRSP